MTKRMISGPNYFLFPRMSAIPSCIKTKSKKQLQGRSSAMCRLVTSKDNQLIHLLSLFFQASRAYPQSKGSQFYWVPAPTFLAVSVRCVDSPDQLWRVVDLLLSESNALSTGVSVLPSSPDSQIPKSEKEACSSLWASEHLGDLLLGVCGLRGRASSAAAATLWGLWLALGPAHSMQRQASAHPHAPPGFGYKSVPCTVP